MRGGAAPRVEARDPVTGGHVAAAHVTRGGHGVRGSCCHLTALAPARLDPLALHGPADDGHVERRLQLRGELRAVLGLEPAHGEGELVPGAQVEHAGQQPQAVVIRLLAAFLRGQSVETARHLGVLPRPLEPQRGDVVGEAVDDEDHLPGPLVGGPVRSPGVGSAVVLRYPPVGVHCVANVGPALKLSYSVATLTAQDRNTYLVFRVSAIQQIDSIKIFHFLSTFRSFR